MELKVPKFLRGALSKVAFRRNLLTWLIAAMTILTPAEGQQNGTPNRSPNVVAYMPTLTFDVTSVRECPPGDNGQRYANPAHSSRMDGSGLWVAQLIGWAYGMDWRSQVLGGPDWVQSTRFNVQATSDGAADDKLVKLTDDQAKLEKQHMLQVLLSDRFKLKVHMETKQMPAFVLAIARHGQKLHTAASADSNPVNINGSRHPPIGSNADPRGIAIVGRNASITDLVSILQFQTRMNVIDQTGLTENYDFTLQFHGTLSEMNDDNGTKWPPVETAIQEQLGLQLKETKAPISVIVIDHIEKPSEN